MVWVVDVHRRVWKWLKRHPEARNIVEKVIEDLKRNPYVGEPYKGKLKGKYKYRKGRIRIIYTIDNTTKTIRIWDIGYRENIYEKY